MRFLHMVGVSFGGGLAVFSAGIVVGSVLVSQKLPPINIALDTKTYSVGLTLGCPLADDSQPRVMDVHPSLSKDMQPKLIVAPVQSNQV